MTRAGENSRRIAGFFPGLGSRAFYQNLDRGLLDSGIPEVVEIYQEGARALGFPGRPEKLLLNAGNVPAGRAAAQGFVGAALLVHSLALAAHLRARSVKADVPVRFVAYTGESFGIITAAVAGGALSVADGVRLGRAFTPLMLAAAEGHTCGDQVTTAMAAYLPEPLRGRPLVPEPHHVLALRAEPAKLGRVLADIARTHPATDVEVHKHYSRRQTNVYVRAGVKPDFDRFIAKYPEVSTEELKARTTFLAHSRRMSLVRRSFEYFMDDTAIEFHRPHTPVVSNSGGALLTTAADVRDAVLAITDEVMDSQTTVETLDDLRPDVIVELGLGDKSVQLLLDNEIDVPVTSYSGPTGTAQPLLPAMQLMDTVLQELETLRAGGDRPTDRQVRTLREIVRRSEANSFCDRYFYQGIGRVIAGTGLHRDRTDAPAFHRFLEIYQHTRMYRDEIDWPAGELVLQARLKKRLVGPAEGPGRIYAELTVVDVAGTVTDRRIDRSDQHEAVVFHFDRLPDLTPAELARNTATLLETQPLARQIYDQVRQCLSPDDDLASAAGGLVYQYVLFHLLRLHRPVMFRHGYYLAGSDPTGWLVALCVSGATPLPDVVRLHAARLRSDLEPETARAALDRVLDSIGTPDVPLISPQGIPLQARIDVEATTRAVLL